ncbi:polysaccharide deacetylase family protein [Chryseobacterium taeanense]|uniref:polysaccharide deacetylase family protein n=1 Tax=Chryseobacterium taeanense TaxID=311334 RepID=UPI0035AECA6C
MSKETFIGGDLIEEIGGSYKIYTQDSYELSSGKQIIYNGEVGVSHDSPKTPAISKENKVTREIYLTFDDGIQAGTEEVLQVLKDTGVKGTFFLTGIHLYYFIEKSKDRKKALAIFKDIYENHAIANHSYSHANDSYTSYYSKGVKTDNKNTRRSVFTDFVKCKEQILSYLDEIYGKGEVTNRSVPLAKNQKIPLARFPGRNTWYTKNIQSIDSDNNKDTKQEAKELYDERDYQVYGWDVEWHMEFAFAKHSQELIQKSGIDFSKDEDSHPYYDMYSSQNIGFDRVKDSWESVRDELLDYVYHSKSKFQFGDDKSKTDGKVILLMHERAFRRGKKGDLNSLEEAEKLKKLIMYFKDIKAEFKTLDKY